MIKALLPTLRETVKAEPKPAAKAAKPVAK